MLKILILTSERFNSDIISIGIDSAYLNWNTTFPAVSLCLVKGMNVKVLRFRFHIKDNFFFYS